VPIWTYLNFTARWGQRGHQMPTQSLGSKVLPQSTTKYYFPRTDSVTSHWTTLDATCRHDTTQIAQRFPFILPGPIAHNVHLGMAFLDRVAARTNNDRPPSRTWSKFPRLNFTSAASMLSKTRSMKSTRIRYCSRGLVTDPVY
jgi:hypothetical protein